MTRLQQIRNDFSTLDVLYVEDEEEVKDMSLTFFNNIFTHIDSASNGQEGLALFKENSYDLVITDLKMPKMNGREMLKQIDALDKECVKLVITASDSDIDASQTACDVYLNKPLELMVFIEAIESLHEKLSARVKRHGSV